MYKPTLNKDDLLTYLYLNGYTKRRCTKYKLLLTSSDISASLRESRFQTNVKCSWWRSHHCLCLVLWTFCLFRLIFFGLFISRASRTFLLYMFDIKTIVLGWIQLNYHHEQLETTFPENTKPLDCNFDDRINVSLKTAFSMLSRNITTC